MIGELIVGLIVAFGGGAVGAFVGLLASHPRPQWPWVVEIERDGLIYDITVSVMRDGKSQIKCGSALTHRAAVRRAARMACAVETRSTYSFATDPIA